MSYFYVALAVVCNVAAQFLLKSSVGVQNCPKFCGLHLNVFMLGGLLAYAVSFYLTILVYKTYSVSFIGPFMMAAIVILVAGVDRFGFGSVFDLPKIIGLTFVFAGICFLSFSKS